MFADAFELIYETTGETLIDCIADPSVADKELESTHKINENVAPRPYVGQGEFSAMLDCLKTNDLSRKKWQCFNEERFQVLLNSPEEILKQLTKQELKLCFEVINEVLVEQNIHVGNSWPKYKLCHLLYCLVSGLTFLQSDCSNYIKQAF